MWCKRNKFLIFVLQKDKKRKTKQSKEKTILETKQYATAVGSETLIELSE